MQKMTAEGVVEGGRPGHDRQPDEKVIAVYIFLEASEKAKLKRNSKSWMQ